jgi:sirohydrochlorin cobaltochelatase
VSVLPSTAYLLVSHGSRDPRPGQALERLAQFVRQAEAGPGRRSPRQQPPAAAPGAPLAYPQVSFSQPKGRSTASTTTPQESRPRPKTTDWAPTRGTVTPLVGTACLEATSLPLHQQVIDFGRRASAMGITTLRIVPLFLLKGVHVMDDIPAEVQQAQQALPDMALEICPYLGSHPGLGNVIRKRLEATTTDSVLLLAHGSRRPGGNATVEGLAQSLGGTAAFWAVAPHLETQVIQLMQSGVQRLAIAPYFLFAGTLTDAITQATEELAERFPQMGLHLLPPLGPTQDLANLVVDLALKRVQPKTAQAAPLKRVAFKHQVPTSLVS